MKSIISFVIVLINLLGCAHACDRSSDNSLKSHLDNNKRIVRAFYNNVINKKQFTKASSYLGTHYKQHDPNVEEGATGLQHFIEFLREKYPQAYGNIQRIIAENDYVMLHVHAILEPGTKGSAVFDVFRLQNGKIVEHWGAYQPVPDIAKNNNGMF